MIVMKFVCILCKCFMRYILSSIFNHHFPKNKEFIDIDRANFIDEAMFVSKFANVFFF